MTVYKNIKGVNGKTEVAIFGNTTSSRTQLAGLATFVFGVTSEILQVQSNTTIYFRGMASKYGNRPVGSDGSDHWHRESIAWQYKVRYANRRGPRKLSRMAQVEFNNLGLSRPTALPTSSELGFHTVHWVVFPESRSEARVAPNSLFFPPHSSDH